MVRKNSIKLFGAVNIRSVWDEDKGNGIFQ